MDSLHPAEVTVHFSAEEWALLEEWQRELHREVTAATAQLLASLGRLQWCRATCCCWWGYSTAT
uniref:KRAB domain-containing protein n=1 Tax=Gallus gallus TaxID=9031 RepID=A0A8V1A344_CHICK